MPSPSIPPAPDTLMILAGEVSGDQHAAALVRALRAERPAWRFIGFGGPEMRAAGVETRFDIADLAVLGLTEVIRRYGFFRGVMREMLALAARERPRAVILVDYPGFNLRFAKAVRRLGPRVIFYICPQVWAWHRERIPHMARILDRLITIFPFEPALFLKTSLRVDFAGHPLVDAAADAWSRPPVALPWGGRRRVALLPGSRQQEVRRLLPDLWAAAAEIDRRCDDVGFIIATPDAAGAERLRALLATLPPGPARIEIVAGETRQVLRQAQAALVASGTATLEASLMLCPMAIVYRVAPLTYWVARRLVKIPHIGLVNIVAERQVCPEFIQAAVQPTALADAILPLLLDDARRAAVQADLRDVNTRLGSGAAAQRAAACILDEVERP